MDRRGSGILLHITSLPSPYGIGDLGADAYDFVDFLSETGQSYWQILPLNQTYSAYGNSPYNSFSAFAGNHLLISPDRLVKNGFISDSDIRDVPEFTDSRVNYNQVTAFKETLLGSVYEKHRHSLSSHQEFQRFCNDNTLWLDDYSLFVSVKDHLKGDEWGIWPAELRDRNSEALTEWTGKLIDNVMKEKFLQFLFFSQWYSLKNYCDSKNIKIIGDIPIYVNYDSADVWANPGIFNLDENRKPVYVAGVPPDYFSASGQLWGHPIYRWDVLKKSGYLWWIQRIKHKLKTFHMFRLDHFRGFVGYWQVSAGEKNAINGKWMEAPARDFFKTLLRHIPKESVIAEDLGIITEDVRDVIREFGFPGMKIILFAFSDNISENPYVPHNHIKNCVIYTGTHDNNTIKGWYRKDIDDQTRKLIAGYVGREISEKSIHRELIRLAMMSVADTVIIPMQDILGMGETCRMNLPASSEGNWEWRLEHGQLSSELTANLKEITEIYGRSQHK